MTLNNFIEAIAGKLTAVWPDRKVYVDEIPKDADGQFFVGIIESEQEKHLDRRWKRSIQFDVLTVKETDQKDRTVRLTGQKATPNKNARVFQFTFDADFFFVVTPPEIPFMENLDQTEEVK